ncbi:MAG: 4Fe-4S binding protein [Candidatus Edwardsbacteria bacterium]|nr:4Fe-4S binding protein [Candidatus Edwardsbacteria bacterium]
MEEHTEALGRIAADRGMAVFGVAELAPVRGTFRPEIVPAAQGLTHGISMGYRLSDPVLDGISDRPTLIYKHHYKVANYMLDQAAAHVAAYIHRQRKRALPVPASQVIDWKDNYGHLSHKAIAAQAGLGWIGRSALFLHPVHRGRLRLVTVLTDLPLVPGIPLPELDRCGTCRACIDACPAGAISEAGYDRIRCAGKLKEFSRMPGIGQSICGVCVRVCPR